MTTDGFSIEELQAAIAQSDAGWVAEESPFAAMSDRECALLLDYALEPEDTSPIEHGRAADAPQDAIGVTLPEFLGYPSSYDLRNVNGQSFITPIRNQGGCGSGVVFDVAAAVEGTFRRQRNNPSLPVDFSEAHLFYCYAREDGCGCATGWGTPEKALDAFRDRGVVDEACFPYTAGDQDCHLCADWRDRLTRITGWRRLTSSDEMKHWISTRGPLVACFQVYRDFMTYRAGIYRHVSGDSLGGTATCCVGYDDAQEYWICKLSWGTAFGENGFFRIAYGECGIDWAMYAVEGIEETGWCRNTRIIGAWTNNHDRNAHVYVQNMGWRQVCPDNDNIFFDMLAQLLAAKAGNRPVDFYQQRGQIKKLCIW